MPLSFSAGVRDSLSNLAASLGVGRDKAAHDAFRLFTLERAQIEALYRGDWLARKVVDIVPYDSIRAWRAWSGHRSDVDRMEAAERRLGLRKTIQRAMTLGRLYGGGAILIGTGESDPAALARPLDERLPRGGLTFLHVVSRWQLGVAALDNDPLSPWCGEPALYELSAPGRPALALHPSRVVRFLGHPLPDPTLSSTFWSDSVLQVLYDAVHAVALTTAGATSLMHEAKVDIVTVPNLSEHLSSAETTQQLSARFAYAAAMKSINNLLLLGDGESWSRQSVDFAGLPEMVRTFLQVAAGAADIPVTRLLGQSPAGLSATGDSDTRNYYDMIAARQELDLRPQLERLDRLIAHSEGLDPGALRFAFRPLWQLDAPSQAALALSKAQATQIYAGLKLWPAEVTARLVEAQLVADGTYPNAAAVFAGRSGEIVTDSREVGENTWTNGSFWFEEPRDWRGRWATAGEARSSQHPPPIRVAQIDPMAGGNPDIDEQLAQEEKHQEHRSGFLHHVDPEDPIDVLGAALNPFKNAGGGGTIRMPPPAGAAARTGPVPSTPTTARPPVGIGPGGTGAPADPTSSVEPSATGTLPPSSQVPVAAPGASRTNGPLRSPAPPAPIAPTPGAITFNPDGSFSITDWTGYPEGAPQPPGPFRLLTGDEYEAARKKADQTNLNLHRSNPLLKSLDIHHILPIKFGGSPDDPKNRIALARKDHEPFSVWWLRVQRFVESGEGQ